jgi:hypothetical protein
MKNYSIKYFVIHIGKWDYWEASVRRRRKRKRTLNIWSNVNKESVEGDS